MQSVTHESKLWQLLARVRGVRVRRRLRVLAEARRLERRAAAAVVEQLSSLERHAEQRERVLAFCRRDQRSGAQWFATLRAHDALKPSLQRQVSDAQQAHKLARDEAGEALRKWNMERVRHEDAKQRWRAGVARAASIARESG
jgi:hypothetical protein